MHFIKSATAAAALLLASAWAQAPKNPPLGDYVCSENRWDGSKIRRDLKGTFTLLPGNKYRYLEGGEVGSYSYDPAARKLTFTGGYFGNTNATGLFTPRDRTSQIDINFSTKTSLEWHCGHNN